jgi:hypothetical protein
MSGTEIFIEFSFRDARFFMIFIKLLCRPRAMGSDETLPSSSNDPIYEVCKVWWVHLSGMSGTEDFIGAPFFVNDRPCAVEKNFPA